MRSYRTIVVDPPWIDGNDQSARKIMSKKYCSDYANTRSNEVLEEESNDYKSVMTVDEVKRFNLVSELADPEGCMLFVWTTNKHLFEVPDIIKAWGFECGIGSVGRTMCWMKIGGVCGGGARGPNQWGSNTEYIVIAKKGSIKWKETKGLYSGFTAPNRGHSVKPAEFYRMIRECTYEPRIDVFARRRHLGFDAWGDEVEKRIPDLLNEFPETKISQLYTGELHEDI